MKSIFTILSSFLFVSMLSAQTNVSLNIEHMLNTSDFAFNTEATAQSSYNFDVTRLQYYISGIELVHDGGQITPVQDTWLLVDAGNDVDFDLGSHDVTSIEGINYYIGVGPDVNNDDPSLWTAGHPLAPQNPSMHWGWTSGYRFVAIEGGAGANTAFSFEVHALGNNNYNQVQIVTEAVDNSGDLEIIVYADYARALDRVDVSSGLLVHASNGEAVLFLEDFANHVFSASSTLGIEDTEFTGAFDLYPNPTESSSQVSYDISEKGYYTVVITGIDGKTVSSEMLKSLSGIHQLPVVSAGVYSVSLEQNGLKVVSHKWVVAK